MSGLIDAVEESSRIANSIVRMLGQVPGLRGSQSPLKDPLSSMTSFIHSLSVNGGLRYGHITDTVVYTGSYKVQPEGGGPAIICCRGSSMPTIPIGVKDACTLDVGTGVIYYQHPRLSYGIIICVEPFWMANAQDIRPDFISQGSRVGLHVDGAHKAPFALGPLPNSNGGIIDFSASRPADGLTGEFCKIAENGLMLFLDGAMALMRVDEECGLSLFYRDQWARLNGHNFQHFTSGRVLESFDDEGEHMLEDGVTPYFWEKLGALNFQATIARRSSMPRPPRSIRQSLRGSNRSRTTCNPSSACRSMPAIWAKAGHSIWLLRL